MGDPVLDACTEPLLRERWLAESLCWTVVEPLGEALQPADVVARLGGSPGNVVTPEEAAAAGREFVDERFLGVVVQLGGCVALIEANGYQGSRPEVLRALSDMARVHNAYWNVTGNGCLSVAAHGSLLAVLDLHDEHRRSGVAPDILDVDLGPLLADREPGPGSLRAEFLALIELRTGVGLDACLTAAAPTHVLIPTEVTGDPRPPGALGRVDPELDVQLRLATEPVRRGELLRLVDALAREFGLADEPAVGVARTLVADGGARRHEDTTALYQLVQRLNRAYVARVNAGGIDEDGPLTRQLDAARAIETAAARPGGWPDPLDAFHWASVAYAPDRWRDVRGNVLASLARDR